MDRPIITLDWGFLKQLSFNWDIDWRGQSLGDTTGGMSQVVYNRFPRWVGSPAIHLRGRNLAKWQAIRAQARGRVGIYKLPMWNPAAFRLSDTGVDFSTTGTEFSTGETFSTGYGFAYEPTCTAVNDAAAGAETIRVNAAAVVPVPGQIMSHERWPFMVVAVSTVSAGVYDLSIQPPLRAAIPSGDPIKLRGEGLFEVTDDAVGRSDYGAGLATNVQLQFQEVLAR